MSDRRVLIAYLVVGAANVLGNAADLPMLMNVTKPLLVPLLLAWLLVNRRGRLTTPLRWLAAGLVFAWLGDLLLMFDGDLEFMAGIGAFLVMQVCYIVAFTRIPGPGFVRAWKITLVPYVAIWIIVNVLVSAGVGSLRIPVLIYSAVLVAMAVSALDLVLRVRRSPGWRVAWGALFFLVSDGLIALTEFGPLSATPTLSALIMATYISAQLMLVTGLAECENARATR
jgi:uncharacterized membrane protein YhhN